MDIFPPRWYMFISFSFSSYLVHTPYYRCNICFCGRWRVFHSAKTRPPYRKGAYCKIEFSLGLALLILKWSKYMALSSKDLSLIANAFLLVYAYANVSLCLLHFVYFPTQDEFYVVLYVYFRVLFTYIFYFGFSKCIFLVRSKYNASLWKVFAVTHIFTALKIPPIVFIHTSLQSTLTPKI